MRQKNLRRNYLNKSILIKNDHIASGALSDPKGRGTVINNMKKQKDEIESDYKSEIETFKKIAKMVYDL